MSNKPHDDWWIPMALLIVFGVCPPIGIAIGIIYAIYDGNK